MKARTEDKVAVGAGCLIILIWLLSFLVSIGLTITVIWAIIHVVSGL